MAKQYMEDKVESLVVVATTYANMPQYSQWKDVVKCTSKSQKPKRRQPLTESPDQNHKQHKVSEMPAQFEKAYSNMRSLQ